MEKCQEKYRHVEYAETCVEAVCPTVCSNPFNACVSQLVSRRLVFILCTQWGWADGFWDGSLSLRCSGELKPLSHSVYKWRWGREGERIPVLVSFFYCQTFGL